MTKSTQSKWRMLIAAQGKSGLCVREVARAVGSNDVLVADPTAA